MITIIELPQVGESVTEGVIGKWLVEPGQRVEKYDPLVEVVTDKVSMEAPSPYTGVFVRALAEEGETVPMGQPICEMDVEVEEPASVIPAQAGIQGARAAHEERSGDEGEGQGEDAPTEDEQPSPLPLFGDEDEPSPEEDPGRVGGAWAMPAAHSAGTPEAGHGEDEGHGFEFMDSVRSVGPTGSGEGGEGRRDALQEQALAEHEHEQAESSVAAPDRRHVISPLVARLSAQHGIDLSTVQGTGAGGRITSKDLLEAVSRMSAPPDGEREEEETGEPLSLEGRGRAESAGEGEPEEAEAVTQPTPEAASPVIPAQAGNQGARAAHEEEVGLVEGLEAPVESETEAEQTVPEAEPASPVIPAQAGNQGARAAHEEEVGLVEGLEAPVESETEAEQTVPEAEPASPVIPAQAGNQGARAAHEEEAGPVGDLEAPDEPAPEHEEPSSFPEEEGEDEGIAAAPAADTSVLPLTPVRRIIAEHMARSAREIPAAWSMVETDVTRLVRARDALKTAFEEKHGVPLTYLPFAVGAVASALREHPRLNARWDDGHITLNNRVNIAIAVATDAGLMVPVLHDADTLTIAAIAVELRRLTDGARQGRLGIEDVQGGTFTLNNTGALGSVVSVPIINHPQAAILTTEAIVKRPVVVEGDAIAVRSMMNLCLAFDHRVCDGADAAAFLSAVKARLEVVDESIGLG